MNVILLESNESNLVQISCISSVNGKSQIGDFVQSGASINAVLLQHGEYVLDMTLSSGSGKGEFYISSAERQIHLRCTAREWHAHFYS